MDKILFPLLVVAAGTSTVLCNSTRTAKLEILRSPTKVAVWKPDPYPILRSYGDELPAPTVRNHTTLPSNVVEDSTKSDNQATNNSTAALNSTEIDNPTKEGLMDMSVTKNDTCMRRDYEEDIAAVFREEAGPIETAALVFNSTVEFSEGKITNVTDLTRLRVLNETLVDCGTYLKLNETMESSTNTDSRT